MCEGCAGDGTLRDMHNIERMMREVLGGRTYISGLSRRHIAMRETDDDSRGADARRRRTKLQRSLDGASSHPAAFTSRSQDAARAASQCIAT